MVLRGNRHKASNYWTRVITHECLRPKTWLKCQLCNCEHCVPQISYQLLEPKPSFKNASYKSKSTFNLHHVHHRLHIHSHVYNLYRHPSIISPICSHELITLERIFGHKKEAIPWRTMCTCWSVHGCLFALTGAFGGWPGRGERLLRDKVFQGGGGARNLVQLRAEYRCTLLSSSAFS